MRLLSAALLTLLLGSATSVRAGNIEVVRVWPAYRTAQSFDRIGLYFNGGEDSAGKSIQRTRPATRDGYYFLVRLDNPGAAVAGATLEVSVITPASPEPQAFSFKADVPAGSHAFDLGLTGPDWPGPKSGAVAWRVTVRAPDGAELASQQSFLWARPASPPAP
jgi:hypothetical protein